MGLFKKHLNLKVQRVHQWGVLLQTKPNKTKQNQTKSGVQKNLWHLIFMYNGNIERYHLSFDLFKLDEQTDF